MYSVNGAQSLKVTPLLLSSVHFLASLSPSPSVVIVPLKSTYASL